MIPLSASVYQPCAVLRTVTINRSLKKFAKEQPAEKHQEAKMKLILVFAVLLLFVGICEGYFQQLPLNKKTSEYLLFQLSRRVPKLMVCKYSL